MFPRDGTFKLFGKVWCTIAGGEATLDNIHFTASNYGGESALLKEVSEQARVQGANRLRVWVSDDKSRQRSGSAMASNRRSVIQARAAPIGNGHCKR